MPAWIHKTSHLFLTSCDGAKAFLPLEDTGGEMFREGIHRGNSAIFERM